MRVFVSLLGWICFESGACLLGPETRQAKTAVGGRLLVENFLLWDDGSAFPVGGWVGGLGREREREEGKCQTGQASGASQPPLEP